MSYSRGTLALRATIRGMSFWAAILLPLVYLPLPLGWLGLPDWLHSHRPAALHLIALFVGHNHTHTNQ